MSITIRIHYPPTGTIVVRTSNEWEQDVPAVRVLEDGAVHEFELSGDRDFIYFKPVLVGPGYELWSIGHNYLALRGANVPYDIYPFFRTDQLCSVSDLREIKSPSEGAATYGYRVFYPPGYSENVLKRYPVLYMQDGQNVFFPNEAFGGHHWKVTETIDLLNQMNLVDKIIVVGIYPHERMRDYTQPGYEAYGRFIVETLKPTVDATFRTLPDRKTTAVMGSSLGGVVSFYLAWQYPDVFGGAACLSSTFGYQDDLLERVASEPPRPVRFYLDTGWPNDNFEVTRSMRTMLVRRGAKEGTELTYLAFPEGRHHESSWATRVHIPIQFLFGKRPATHGV